MAFGDLLPKGEWFYSLPRTWAAGASLLIDPQFLAPAMRKMKAPEVVCLIHRFLGSITVGAGGGNVLNGEDVTRLWSRIMISDGNADGPLVDVTGAGMRLQNQHELGGNIADSAGVANNTTNAAFSAFLPILFDLHRAEDGADTRPPVEAIIDGASYTLQAPTATLHSNGATVNSGTYDVWALVVDARERKGRARLTYNDTLPISNQRDNYFVTGSIRSLLGFAPLAAGGYDAWTGITTVDSVALNYRLTRRDILAVDYFLQNPHALSTADEVATATAISFLSAQHDQKLGYMADVGGVFRLELDAAPPANSRLMVSRITDRSPSFTAKWMLPNVDGATPAQLEAALKERGVVLGFKGSKPIADFSPDLIRRMPIGLKASASAVR